MGNALRDAIITVLTSQYKYDAPEAFKTVKRAGYEVYKTDHKWVVRNPETYKTVYLSYRGDKLMLFTGRGDIDKVDIIAYLNKPYNRDKEAYPYEPSRTKVRDIWWAKRYVQTSAEEVERLEKQLAKARKAFVENNVELTKRRMRYGLIK